MIENLRTALVAVVLIGGMVAFLSGSAHYPAFEKLFRSRMSTKAM